MLGLNICTTCKRTPTGRRRREKEGEIIVAGIFAAFCGFATLFFFEFFIAGVFLWENLDK